MSTQGIRTVVRETITERAKAVAGTAVAEAIEYGIGLLDKAVREGDGKPEVRIVGTLVISRAGGEWGFEGDARAERKEVVKGETHTAYYDPDQPELPFRDDGGVEA